MAKSLASFGPPVKNYLDPPDSTWQLSRFWFLRFLGLIYTVAFSVLVNQWLPLLGADGLLPVDLFLDRVRQQHGGGAFWQLPTLFWLDHSDAFMLALAWIGLGLSLLLLLGLANAVQLFALWLLYLSFCNVGQTFYAFGWEILLLETGFLAVFLAPLKSLSPFWPKQAPIALFWLYRWLLFRLMFGAGLIKIRGDECWRQLTCLFHHFETQPIPNALSWYFHHLPPAVLKAGVLFNHFAELIVPFFYFAPRRLRHWAGAVTVLFQTTLILSGNLSWLNWLTIALCIPLFDDRCLARLSPSAIGDKLSPITALPAGSRHRLLAAALVVLIAYLSIDPALNLVSARQRMNSSFDRLNLVNTYGAFGSVGQERLEIVLEGTAAANADSAATWRPYTFKGKPGDPNSRPPLIAPYHLRLDWQIWFAAMSDYRRHPWLVHFVYKLLRDDAGALSLLGENPFPDGPPRFIRARLYRYRFAPPEAPANRWWTRQLVGTYLPPLAADNPALQQVLAAFGWRY